MNPIEANGTSDHNHDQNESMYFGTNPPQSGPITPPASAEAPIKPNERALLPGGKISPAMAIANGTSAPAPIA